MITFKAQTRKDQIKDDGKSNIKIRLSHNNKTRYIATDYNVKPAQFDNKQGIVISRKHENAMFINTKLREKISEYEKICIDLEDRINLIDMTALLAQLRKSKNGKIDFCSHMSDYISMLDISNRKPYAASIQQTKDRIVDFTQSDKLSFKELNYLFLQRFEGHYLTSGMSRNSLALHFRNMRTVFNNAIKNDLVGLEYYPFRKFKIKKASTMNRDLKVGELSKLYRYHFENQSEERARDLFMLSFFLIGVNMKDLLLAKTDQLQRGRFFYVRSKTKKSYSIMVLPEALRLINKYKGDDNYLLRFMEKKENESMKTDRKTPPYKDVVDHSNKLLKRTGEKSGIGNKLSTYWARHTWASIANELEIPETVIRLALGHSSQSVTSTYINIDLEKVDQANQKVIKYLLKTL